MGRILSVSFIIYKVKVISYLLQGLKEIIHVAWMDQDDLSASLACINKCLFLPTLLGPVLIANRSAKCSVLKECLSYWGGKTQDHAIHAEVSKRGCGSTKMQSPSQEWCIVWGYSLESISEWGSCVGPRFGSSHCHLITLGPWPTHFASLSLSFLICKVGLFILTCRVWGRI